MKKTKAPEKGSPGNLVSLSRKELEALAVKYDQPAYRGKQIFDAVYKHGKRSIVDIVQVKQNTGCGFGFGMQSERKLSLKFFISRATQN